MGNNVTMSAKDTLFAALAECFVTIGKTKTEVPILGKTGKGNKATGWKGTGSLTAHYNTSIFRKMMLDYKNTGEDVYFEMQITNEDPTSGAGRQTIILMDARNFQRAYGIPYKLSKQRPFIGAVALIY